MVNYGLLTGFVTPVWSTGSIVGWVLNPSESAFGYAEYFIQKLYSKYSFYDSKRGYEDKLREGNCFIRLGLKIRLSDSYFYPGFSLDIIVRQTNPYHRTEQARRNKK